MMFISDNCIKIIERAERMANLLKRMNAGLVLSIEESKKTISRNGYNVKGYNVDDILVLTNCVNSVMMAKLDEHEKRAAVLRKEIRKLESDSSVTSVTEKELKTRFAEIREKIRSGETDNIRALIEQFVHRVNVYPDRIEVIFNFYPDKVKYIPKTENEGRADVRSSLFVPDIMVAESSKDNK